MAPSITNDNGGYILTNIRPMALWATITWSDGTESMYQNSSLRCEIDQFFFEILDSDFIPQLSQLYSRPGHPIRGGPFLGTAGLGINTGGPKNLVYDSIIQSALEDGVITGYLPRPTQDTCYFIFIPTDANVINDQGLASQPSGDYTGYDGYHHSFVTQDGRTIFYCVITPLIEDDEKLTHIASHELAEVITDPITGTAWVGPPDPVTGALQEICDLCEPGEVILHGYHVSTYLTSSPQPGLLECGPGRDNVQPGFSTTAYIQLEASFTRTSCHSHSIIEGQSAFFQAEAFYHDVPTMFTLLGWTSLSPDGVLIETEGNTGREYSIIVPFGMKTFEVRVELITSLGCLVGSNKRFNVITQEEADAEEALCRFIAEISRLLHIYKWPIPIPLPGPPPPWYPDRDFTRYPLTDVELDDILLLGEQLIEFARVARSLTV